MIAPGDDIPSVPVKLVDAHGAANADSRAVLSAGRVVFFTVPGAFTPTCHTNHLPGYVDLAEAFHARGIDRIVCGAVNDHHVVKAWAAATGSLGRIDFIADGNAALCRAMGLERDMTGSGMGIRYIRAAIVLDNGKVAAVHAEKAPGEVTSSGAQAVLATL